MFGRIVQSVTSKQSEKQIYICQSCLRKVRCPLVAHRGSSAPTLIRTNSHIASPSSKVNNVPAFRAVLKNAAKAKKSQKQSKKESSNPTKDAELAKWELTVGIEIHAELNTARKLFSGAATSVNEAPNSHVALFDVAFPGSQPQFQQATLLPALRAALALNCEIQMKSGFDRKHYFYQDQPAGYQITQYYEPLAKDGYITLLSEDFPQGISPSKEPITIGIKQIQMEQDTAKTVNQSPSTYLLDFNRVSHPLIEIITLPQIHDPIVAAACVRKVQRLLRTVNAVTAGMEVGGLRADVNVSVRERHGQPDGQSHSYHGVVGLGQRTEIKNLSSLKAVEEAIVAERDRQIELLEGGGVIEGETRGWTLGSKTTTRLRGKEGEIDYRYMPDPDIAPVILSKDLVDELKASLPQLDTDTFSVLTRDPYNLTPKDTMTLLNLDDADTEGDRVDYYFSVVDELRRLLAADPKLQKRSGRLAGNWVIMDLTAHLKTLPPSTPISHITNTILPPSLLASLISHILLATPLITPSSAKLLLAHLLSSPPNSQHPLPHLPTLIETLHLALRPLPRDTYVVLAHAALAEKPELRREIEEAVREGRGERERGKVMWFVGRMVGRGMEMVGKGEGDEGEIGTVEPRIAEGVLREVMGLDLKGREHGNGSAER